ncbi:hypothetical protein MMC30_007245 [Trapelia coarctata]|nr:hypothetical protein [Trapelia coarctata]
MSGGVPSDEVAEDYKASLEFLVSNDRYVINNLTVIAKENTEHADAISKVLEEHIRVAPPSHKLPALYVLDSIAKNIGTPYTLFLGHNLYKTFMGAYSLVDNNIRKKLDDMLKTWRNPVPGSIDSRPVFPPDITRSIDKALLQAKTAALQQLRTNHSAMIRPKSVAAAAGNSWRNTPTPPQNMARVTAPPSQGYVQNGAPNGSYRTNSPYPPYTQFMPPQQTPPQYQPPIQPPIQLPTTHPSQTQQLPDIGSLHRDIDALILTTRDHFARNPYDEGVQTRLKALLDLQTVLKTQQVEPHMIKAARDQVTWLQSLPIPPPAPIPQAPVNIPVAAAVATPPPVQVSYPSQPSLPALPSTTSLADLLASVARSRQGQSAPPPPPSNPTAPLPPPQSQTAFTALNQGPPPSGAENPLIASLRAAGILPPSGNTPLNGSAAQGPTPLSYPPRPSAISTPPVQLASLVGAIQSQQGARNDVELTSASLKIPRPYLVAKIYEARPSQCSTCGRRFLLTEEADSAKRGQSRSWYVDELEWIRSRDNEESIDGSANDGKDSKGLAAAAALKNDPKTKFIPVPSDNALASLPCPICQEKFDPSWNDEAQDFVWMDAEKIGSKVYHASCYSELQKDEANTPRTSTPDSVLGKRKAEATNGNPSPAKIKKELAV